MNRKFQENTEFKIKVCLRAKMPDIPKYDLTARFNTNIALKGKVCLMCWFIWASVFALTVGLKVGQRGQLNSPLQHELHCCSAGCEEGNRLICSSKAESK